MAQLINGRAIARSICDSLQKDIAKLGYAPGLAAILVGDDPASKTYVGLKERRAREVGIAFSKFEFSAQASQGEILKKIRELNEQEDIHGILVQLPLPDHLDTPAIMDTIGPDKDADGFHPKNSLVRPVLAEAVLAALRDAGANLANNRMLIVGNSPAFLDPLKNFFSPSCQEVLTAGADDFRDLSPQADIVVMALGQAHALGAEDIGVGAALIDIGITKMDGQTLGDVDPSAYEKAGAYTPAVGGIGPITVAKLLENTYQLALRCPQCKKS